MKTPVLFLLVCTVRLCRCESLYQGLTCDNWCAEPNDPDPEKYWCNQRRAGEGEQVWRCADRTRYGYLCVSPCANNGKSYTWCRTGHHLNKDWEYCSRGGVSIYGKKCVSECKRPNYRGSYWWCDTEDGSWDYCSPPSEVTPVSYTIYGQEGIGACGQNGKDYWWCSKSMRWEGSGRAGAGADDHWDYCSPDSRHTRYNKECSYDCDTYGESYYHCYDQNRDWDYCSPPMDVNYTYTNEGYLCAGRCAGWCPVLGASGRSHFYSRCDGISSGDTIRGSLVILLAIMYLVY